MGEFLPLNRRITKGLIQEMLMTLQCLHNLQMALPHQMWIFLQPAGFRERAGLFLKGIDGCFHHAMNRVSDSPHVRLGTSKFGLSRQFPKPSNLLNQC